MGTNRQAPKDDRPEPTPAPPKPKFMDERGLNGERFPTRPPRGTAPPPPKVYNSSNNNKCCEKRDDSWIGLLILALLG